MENSCHDGEVVPIPIPSTYVGAQHTTTTPITKDHHTHQQNNNQCSTKLNNAWIKKRAVLVKYRECLKNHAASIGGNATDGCGEFMPSGEEGTLEALKCSACNCHRNFHRKETQGDEYGGLQLVPTLSPHMHMGMIMPLGAMQASDHSEEIEGITTRPLMVKKRFRTKFTAEQKEKMLRFAEKVGWKLQKQEETVVQQLCQEIGIRRRVLKVWMHNNKHNMAKKGSLQLD